MATGSPPARGAPSGCRTTCG